MIAKLLIANRGEIAIRIARTAAEMGIATVAVYSEDDAASLHTRKADEARPLKGKGAAAYLDAAQIVAVARESGCDAVHPGYGFLSENAEFARACADAGLIFVGPSPETLALFGDKAAARALAEKTNVPTLRGTEAASLDDIRAFFKGPVMLKAVAGGGGRGMRVVRDANELAQAYELLRLGSQGRVRQRRGLCRGVSCGRAPHRSPDRRRRHGPCGPSVGARMQPAAPPPEDHRDRAGHGRFRT